MTRIAMVLSAMSMVLTTSCAPDVDEKKDDLKEISANVPAEVVEISETDASEEVLEVSWTDNSVYASPVAYSVNLALKDGDASQTYEVTDAASPWKYTGASLQGLLMADWGVESGEEVTVIIRIDAVRDDAVVNSSDPVEVKVFIKTPVKPLELAVEPLTVNLQEAGADETAVTFSWTDGNTWDAEYRLALKAGDKTYEVEDLKEKTLSYTHAGFNLILREELAMEASVTATVEASVAAYDADGILASSQSVSFDVKPYGAVTEYKALAVLGTATAAGDDVSAALAMTKGEGTVFTWKGELKKGGTFRILVEPEGAATDYLIPSSDGKEMVSGLTDNFSVAAGESAWTVPSWGIWEVTVDLAERTVAFTESTRKYSAVGMVGPATPNDWDAVAPTLLSTEDNTIFTWEGNLKNGTLRFLNDPSSAGWEVDQYIATEKDLEIVSGETLRLVLAAVGTPRGDNMWKVTEAGTYRITMNIDEMTVLFERMGDMTLPAFDNVKLVGPASPGGWEASAMSPMEKDGDGWKWTGRLNSGELKFVCNQEGDNWGTTQLLAKVPGQGVSEFEGLEYSCNVGGDDNKWEIRYSGEYTVEISRYATVKFTIISLDPVPDQSADVLAENYPSLGLIGNAAPDGWSQTYAGSTMLPDGEGIYKWTGTLKQDVLHIMCDVTKTDWSSPRLTSPFDNVVAVSGKPLPMVWKQNDKSWIIPQEGTYTVVVDLNTMTITFTLETR